MQYRRGQKVTNVTSGKVYRIVFGPTEGEDCYRMKDQRFPMCKMVWVFPRDYVESASFALKEGF